MCTEEQIELVLARKITPQLFGITTKLEITVNEMRRLADLISSQRTDSSHEISRVCSDIGKIEETIYGNGKEGLIIKIQRNHEWIQNQIWFQRLVITALVGNVIATFLVLIKSFISP